jgi:hypothetical protein
MLRESRLYTRLERLAQICRTRANRFPRFRKSPAFATLSSRNRSRIPP